MSQTFCPKSVSPDVLDQEQFACIISLIFLIFLKHNPPINFSLIKTILQYFTHAFICFYASWSVKKGEKIKVLRSSNFHAATGMNFIFVDDGWFRVLRPFNSISVISRRWKGEHKRLCAMKRRLGSGRISPPVGFEPTTPWSEVGSANRSATWTLLFCGWTRVCINV